MTSTQNIALHFIQYVVLTPTLTPQSSLNTLCEDGTWSDSESAISFGYDTTTLTALILVPDHSVSTMEHAKRDREHNALIEILKRLHATHDTHDTDIVCGVNTFTCHGHTLWSRSKYFAAAWTGGFEVMATQSCETISLLLMSMRGARTQRIELPEENPHLITKLIDFCYTSDYVDTKYTFDYGLEVQAYISKLHTNAEMYAMGERYGVQGLKELAVAKFETALVKEPSESISTHMITLIPLIYAGTPGTDRGMGDRILAPALAYPKQLSGLPGFKSMIAENVDFVTDVFQAMSVLSTIPPHREAWH